jgi:predicted nucleic acid-binding protein
MNVLIDSPIWSLAFRRATATSPEAAVLGTLARMGQAKIIGAVRQEVLSGIQTPERFAYIRDRLRAFPDLPLGTTHYELAAEYYNVCRSNGVQGSHADFLVCAVANLARLPIFTTDRDFKRYAQHLPIKLYTPR